MKKYFSTLLAVIILANCIYTNVFATSRYTQTANEEIQESIEKNKKAIDENNGFLLPVEEVGSDMPAAGEDGFIIPVDDMPSRNNESIELFSASEGGFMAPISEPDPSAIVITTAEELANIESGESYVLGNDIDLSTYNNGVWEPISNIGSFVLDGQGHKIVNMNIPESANQEYAGLFGKTNVKIEIKNIGIESSSIHGAYAGGIVGLSSNYCTISNCYNIGEISVTTESSYGSYGYSYAGGIVGLSSNDCTISNCYNIGEISVTTESEASFESEAYVGGIVGKGSNDCTISNCYNIGEISITTESEASYGAYAYVGGIVGIINNDDCTISNCYNTGEISATIESKSSNTLYAYAGGIEGEGLGSSRIISNCYNTGEISATVESESSNANAYAGGIEGNSNVTISNCYNTGEISAMSKSESSNANAYAGGIAGIGDTISNCYNTGEIFVTTESESSNVSDAYAGGILGSGSNYIYIKPISNCYNTGDISAMSKSVYAGGIAGWGVSTINNCYNIGDISAMSKSSSVYAGGIEGGGSSTISNCYNTGNISVTTESEYHYVSAGGILGYCSSGCTISNCYNTGEVSATAESSDVYASGIAKGDSNCTIINCYNTGNISATSKSKSSYAHAYAGGILGDTGYYESSTISNCYNTGNISATAESESSNAYAYAGGIESGVVDRDGSSIISSCYNTGNISAMSESKSYYAYPYAYAGGIIGIGYSSGISGCYNTGGFSAVSNYRAYEDGIIAYDYDGKYSAKDCYDFSNDDLELDEEGNFIYFDSENSYINGIDQSINITGKISPKLSSSEITYKVSNESVAVIENTEYTDIYGSPSFNLTIKSLSAGKCFIEATAESGASDVCMINVSDPDNKEYEIEVVDKESGEAIQGAEIIAAGKTFTTDEKGIAVFYEKDISPETKMFDVQAEGYVRSVEKLTSNAKQVALEKRINDIYIVYAELDTSDTTSKVLHNGNKYIIKESEFKNKIFADVDWGTETPGDIELILKDSDKTFTFTDGIVEIALGLETADSERIEIAAYNEDRSKSASLEILTEKMAEIQPVDIDLPEADMPDEKSPLDALSIILPTNGSSNVSKSFGIKLGKKFNFSMDEDKISLKCGDIFEYTLEEDSATLKVAGNTITEHNDGSLTLGGNTLLGKFSSDSVELSGKIKFAENLDFFGVASGSAIVGFGFDIPIVSKTEQKNSDNKIKGRVSLDADLKFKKSHNFVAGTVPMVIDTELKPSIGATLSSETPINASNKVKYSGSIAPGIGVSVGAGVGQDYNAISAKVGAKLKGGINPKYIYDGDSWLDLKTNLGLFVFAELKAWVFEAGAEANILSALYNAEILKSGQDKFYFKELKLSGFIADLLGLTTPSAASLMSAGNIKAKSRDYLKNGGGFAANNTRLFSSDDESDGLIFKNIYSTANGQIQNIDGKDVLVFLTDDTSRKELNALEMVYTVNENGVWTEPKAIYDDGTVDSVQDFDGKFIVWENTKKKFTASPSSIADILKESEICFSIFDGTNWSEPINLTDNDHMDSVPTVKACGDKALIAWVSNDANDFSYSTGKTNINYCIYDGKTISDIASIENVGVVPRVELTFDGTKGNIIYKSNNKLYKADTASGTVEEISTKDGFLQYAYNDDILVAFYEDGSIIVNKNGVEEILDSEAVLSNGAPQLVTNGTDTYIYWIENENGYAALKCISNTAEFGWSEKMTAISGDYNVSVPHIAVREDGSIAAAYLKEADIVEDAKGNLSFGQADLYCRDLEIEYGVTVEKDSLKYNELTNTISLNVLNSGFKPINGYTLDIYQNDKLIKTQNFNDTLKAGSVKNVELEQELSFGMGNTVILGAVAKPLGVEGKSGGETISVGASNLCIDEAYIYSKDNKYFLAASVKNNGYVVSSQPKISVYKDSESGVMLAQKSSEFILPDDTAYYEFQLPQPDFSSSEILEYVVVAEDMNEKNITLYDNSSLAIARKVVSFDDDNSGDDNNGDDKQLYGDVDCINGVTGDDALLLLNKVLYNDFKLPIQEKRADWMVYADVDANGKLTATDAAVIMKKVIEKDFVMPVEAKN